jgi:hypothetical protein
VFLLSPNSCANPWSDSGHRELDFWQLTHGCCSSRAAQARPVRPVRVTGLTGVCHLWDLSWVNRLTRVSMGLGAAGQLLVCLELFCKALCRGFLLCRFCFGSVLVPGPKEVTEALWNTCCAAAVATSLTGPVHRSDRCHRSDRRRPSV